MHCWCTPYLGLLPGGSAPAQGPDHLIVSKKAVIRVKNETSFWRPDF